VDATNDGLSLLREDHRAMVELFQQIEAVPRGIPADTEGMQRKRKLFEQVSAALSRHAMAEEQLLYPLARRVLDGGDALADHALAEHQQVKETLVRLDGLSVDNLDFDGEIRSLMATIRDHVKEEENDLFPALESRLTAGELAELARDLERAERMAPTRPHPNAPNQPPFNVLAGAGVAVVDKARDALSGRGDIRPGSDE
jgi:hemerythrin-like domain-containing protein